MKDSSDENSMWYFIKEVGVGVFYLMMPMIALLFFIFMIDDNHIILQEAGIEPLWLLVPAFVLLVVGMLLRIDSVAGLSKMYLKDTYGYIEPLSRSESWALRAYSEHRTTYQGVIVVVGIVGNLLLIVCTVYTFADPMTAIIGVELLLLMFCCQPWNMNIEDSAQSYLDDKLKGGLLDEHRDKWIADVFGTDRFEKLVEGTLDEFEIPDPEREEWVAEWAENRERLLSRDDEVGAAFRTLYERWWQRHRNTPPEHDPSDSS